METTANPLKEYRLEPRLSLVTLGVRDLPGAVAFYESLGWRRSSVGGDEVAFFQLGAIGLALWGRVELAADAGVASEGSGFRSVAIAYNVREAPDVDRVLEAVEARGATILKPAADAFWGGRTGYFADPDGHLWEVAWNPGFPLDEAGGLHIPD